jgi:hypothetical protein
VIEDVEAVRTTAKIRAVPCGSYGDLARAVTECDAFGNNSERPLNKMLWQPDADSVGFATSLDE